MIKSIKKAIQLRGMKKELQLLAGAADCLNKIRTSVPDVGYPGETIGSGGIEIKDELKTTALKLNENLKSLLTEFHSLQPYASKTQQELEAVMAAPSEH